MSYIQIATEAAWWYFSEWNPSTMNELPVIDTLRYSNRLKDAGFPADQAEEMSRALNDEMTSGLATQADVRGLKADIRALDAKFDAKFEAVNAKFDAKIDAVDGKLDTMGRYGLLVMALIVALGLYNAVAPRIGGDSPGPVAAETKAVALAHEVAELAAGR